MMTNVRCFHFFLVLCFDFLIVRNSDISVSGIIAVTISIYTVS